MSWEKLFLDQTGTLLSLKNLLYNYESRFQKKALYKFEQQNLKKL